jgi:hypothetical protein
MLDLIIIVNVPLYTWKIFCLKLKIYVNITTQSTHKKMCIIKTRNDTINYSHGFYRSTLMQIILRDCIFPEEHKH